MSTADIIAKLSYLDADERRQILERLLELEEQDLLNGIDPTREEKALLDHAVAEFERDGNIGTPWREVLRTLRSDPGA